MAEASVLVVDDDASYRALLRHVLTAAGFTVLEASDAASALDVALDGRPDVVLLDWRMPGESGIVALRRLRAEDELREVRIAMVTGLDDPRDRHLARQAGADAFLVKTGDPEVLAGQVQKLLAGGGARFERAH